MNESILFILFLLLLEAQPEQLFILLYPMFWDIFCLTTWFIYISIPYVYNRNKKIVIIM